MRALLTVLAAAVVLFPLTANATDVWGDQWGTWTRDNSPYNVVGEIRVPAESTLAIEPGVVVNFKGHYKFIVDSLATLLAVGTESDSIYFTTEDTTTGWHGIWFIYADSNSQVSYCRLEYGRGSGAILCSNSSSTIANNTISSNSADCGGAISCSSHSQPMIRHNRIAGNSAVLGGGIYTDTYSSPIILNNVIYDNSADWGGGIFCHFTSPTIAGNTINGNLAEEGGGIYCYERSSPAIENNTISDNSVAGEYSCGGGIFCDWYSNPTIANNRISGNAAGLGGGIFCYDHSNPNITGNTICGNTARLGGGICCDYSADPLVSNNSISCNSGTYGGGICCYDSNPTIRNTILWGDIAPNGSEIYLYNSRPTVNYCDVEDGWPGIGNIDVGPLFVGPERDDFHLRWHSPCVDAGDPSLTDPDGSRSDMGAFYFDQDVYGIVELYPHDTPIVIPADGGDIVYDGWVFNFLGYPVGADVWTYAFVPGIGRYGPIDLYENVRVPADSVGMNQITQEVPGAAPEGEYVFVAYVGDYPTTIIDSSCIYFSKTGSIGGGMSQWFQSNRWLKERKPSRSNLRADYALSQNWPNPFNATTAIDYQLSADAYVKLEVYNSLGQKVATLVDERQEAGYKSVIWDASSVCAGLYFYKLTGGDFTQIKSMILIK